VDPGGLRRTSDRSFHRGVDRFADREERLGEDTIEESDVPFDGVAKSTNWFRMYWHRGRCVNYTGRGVWMINPTAPASALRLVRR
jgi:hypothetical protein